MIKKFSISISLIIGFCVLTKYSGYHYSGTIKTMALPSLEQVRFFSEKTFYKHLNFANELIPVGDKKIDYRMRRALKANSYGKLQTYKLHNRAEKWFPVVEPILSIFGIPEDFKYVPLVESGLTRSQYSSKGAAGPWQFMPQTARDYGLKVNGEVDERMNMRLSTIAAAKYLKDLHKIFKSWTLAAAAYNGGEGLMKKQINRQNQDNYFKMRLNRETSRYVYSLISMKEIIENPENHGYSVKNPRILAYQR